MELNIDNKRKTTIKIIKFIILFICIICFFAIAENVFHKEIMKSDSICYNIIDKYLISDFATPIAKFITNFGGVYFIITLTIVLFLCIKNKKIGLAIIFNLAFATILNIILKNILQRPRPTEFRLINEFGYSFPSGHSMVSTAFYGFIIYLIYKYVKNKHIKIALITILCILIISIGISRIYLGVHYTSDVLGGFLISIAYLIIYITVIEKYKDKIMRL